MPRLNLLAEGKKKGGKGEGGKRWRRGIALRGPSNEEGTGGGSARRVAPEITTTSLRKRRGRKKIEKIS